MNKSEITTAKFKACFRTSMSKVGLFGLYKNKRLDEYDISEFNKLMIKYDLEEYSDLLFRYFMDIIETNKLNEFAEYGLNDKSNAEFRLELLHTLEFLLLGKTDLTVSITIKKSKTHPIKNEQLIYEIEQFTEQLFKKFFPKQDLSIENIQSLIPLYKDSENKKEGAPSKNHHLTILAAEIGDLIKVDRFIATKNIVEIDQIKLVANNHGFIYHCLDFWGFIEPREQNSSTPAKYIYQTLAQGKKFFPINYDEIRKKRLSDLKEKLTTKG